MPIRVALVLVCDKCPMSVSVTAGVTEGAFSPRADFQPTQYADAAEGWRLPVSGETFKAAILCPKHALEPRSAP